MAKERILIVEDSMIVSLHMKSVLEYEGYKVIATVDTAEEAIILAERESPDLIMMDIMLAGEMTGIEAAEIIQKQSHIPIIFLSALSDKHTINHAKLTAPLSFITKPFEEGDLLTRIEISLYKTKLEKENERLRLAYIIEGQESERARVSRELHDGLGQLLSAIRLNLDLLEPNCSGSVKEKVDKLIVEAIGESRRIYENMLPSRLLDFSLSESISELCKQLNTAKITIEFLPQPITLILSEQQKLAFYRIVQESINNAIKHSACNKIIIQLFQTEDTVHLSVEDNGQGFQDYHKKESGRGLNNIKYRVEVLKGKLRIETSKDLGTLIGISAPINP